MPIPIDAELYRTIIEQAGDAILFADREGVIRLWNAGAEALFGHPAATALGQSLDLIIPEPMRARHWEGYHRVMAGAPSRYGHEVLQVPALRADGSRFSCAFTIVMIRDADGEPQGIAAILRDVSAQWQREQDLKARLAASSHG